MLFTGGLRVNPIVVSLQEWAPLFLALILAVLPVVAGGAAQAQGTQQSATPAQPAGIADNTDSGDDDDLITNFTSITVMGVAARGAAVALTASATRNGIDYGATASSNADAADGRYTISLNLATATTDDLATIPSGSIDGSWNITARQTETGKEESEPSPALTVTIDTRKPSFRLWVGYPDGRTSGTAASVSSISGGVRGLASHNGILYAVDDDTDTLRRVDVTTGEADIVGSFGSVEASPTGLASHSGVLYMVGGDNDALYSLDTTTGQPTQIGSFGSTEPTPTGLASHDGILYMVGDDKDALYEIDTSDGTAARVGSLGTEQTPGGLASHNGILYMVGDGNNALYTVDTGDGTATRVNHSAESFDVEETSPSGLGSHNGVLYMAGAANSALYDLSTGFVIPEPIGGLKYLPKTTVVVRVSGIDEPGAITATRTVFGNTATWSGESAVFTFREYEHESDDGPGAVTVTVRDAAGNSASISQDIVIDTTAPSLTLDVPATATGAFTATFRFNEDVTWLDPIDITVEEALMGTLEGNGSTYTALITPFDPAVITITVPARAVVDLAGNIGPSRQVRASTRYDQPISVTVEFASDTYQAAESGGTIALTLNLDQTPRREIVVPISVQQASTATANSDYTLPDPSSVTFAADATGTALTQTYTLTIIDDEYDEANETITLGFGTLPPNVTAGTQATTTLTITDDDSRGIANDIPPNATRNIPEGGNYDYGVSLTSKPTDTVTVTLSASPQGTLTLSTGGATPAESIDLTFTAGNWSTPQTVTATASVDPDDDDLTVTITHTATGGDYQALQRDETLTVVDNNVAPVFSPPSYAFNLPENLDGSSSPVNVGTPVSASDSDADDLVSYTITGGNTDDRFAIHSTSGQITYVGSGEDFEPSNTAFSLTVTATGGTGDRAQSATAAVTVNITDLDDTPPTVTSTSFQSDGNAGYAKEGDTITVTFQTSEELSATPSATIAGRTAAVAGSDKSWTAAYTVEAGVNADNAAFDLGVITDAADNETDPPAVHTGIVVDTTAPTVSIAGLPAQITEAFTVSFTFSESVIGFDSDDIAVVNGTLGTVTGSDSTYTAMATPEAQGVVTISVRADAAQDQAGNSGPISMVTASSTQTPVTVAFALATYQASESVGTGTLALLLALDQTPRREVVVPITVQQTSTATAISDYSLPDPSSVTFAADATGIALTQTYTLTIIDDEYDEANETIILGFGTLPPNVSVGPLSTATLTITDDDTRGIAVSIPSEATTNIPEGGNYDYGVSLTSKPTDTVTVTLSASPQGTLTLSTGGATPAESIDLTFTAGNWSTPQTVTATASVDPDDDDLTVTITHTATGGDYQALQRDETLTVVDNNVAPVFSPPSYSFDLPENLDGSSSPVNVGTPVSASDSDSDDSVSYTITGGNTDDKFAIHSTSGQITYVGFGEDFESSTSSYTLTVTANGGTGDRAQSTTATVAVNITDLDDTPPTVTSPSFQSDGNAGYAKEGDTITVTFQTSEELSATPSATIAGRTATVTGSGKSWTAAYTVEAGVNADNAAFDLGVITDAADNETDPPAVHTGIVVDTTAPTVSIAGLPAQITEAFTVSFTFSESVIGFDSDDIAVVNGTLGTVAGSGSTYTAMVTPEAQGVVTISVRADAAQDQAGNSGPISMVTASSTQTPVTVAFASATYQASESVSTGTLVLMLALDQTPRREVVVPITVQQTSTATAISDYTLPEPSSVTFAADATGTALTQTYTLTIIDDDYDEANETIILGFGTLPPNVSVGPLSTATLTITDDDTRGIAVSIPSEATTNIPEGGTYDYGVSLTSKPTDTVTVTLSASPQGTLTLSTGGATPAESIELSFTTANWSTPQTITATASVDPDGEDDTVTITHTASGGDYQGLRRDETLTVVDNNVGPVFNPTSYSFDLPENLDGSSSPVNVGTPVSASDSDSDDSVSYTITGGNTDDKFAIHATSGQITYVGSGEDFESFTSSYTLTVTATGGTGDRAQSTTATVTVTITDVDDTPPAVTSKSFETDGNAGYAKEGDTITVTFQTSEELSATPSATIAGRTATVTGSGKSWTATYTVEAGINADNAAFDLGAITDAADNTTDPPAVHTGIVIDTTAPTVTEVTPVTTPTTQSSPSYVFLSNEAGRVTYFGACGNGSATSVEADTETTTVFSALGVGNYADCRITVTDAAGNPGMVSMAQFTVQLEQSPAPARPSGITDDTDSGIDDDLITSHTSIDVTGIGATGASVSLTASARRGGTDYTIVEAAAADVGDGAYAIALDLATATTHDSTTIVAGSIDGPWNIAARQTETGKRESEPSPALTVIIDTQDPTFKLWVGYPDGQTPGTATKAGSISSSVTGLASHYGVLYAVDDSTDALYRVDIATDTASRTNDDVTNFGLGESPEKSPGGLASHNGVLYMVTADDDALYSLDTSTGEATLIGSFGATETSPTGLTSHNGVLYMVGDSGDALYSIDPASGTASVVVSFSTAEQAPAGLASHSGVLYMVGDHSNALYSLDPATGEATLVGSFDSAEQVPKGLTSHDRVLYLTGAANSAIYTLSTGVAIPEPIDGVAYLRKSTVFVRISGIDDPGTAIATRTVFGHADQQSGETSVLTFSNYDSESDGTGTVVVEVTDAAGNSASMSQSIVIDTNAPRLTVSGAPAVANKPFTAVFEFNEVVAGFDADGIMVENGTLSEFDAADAPVYSALITPTDQGEVTITVAAEAVADKAGNAGPQLQVSTTTLYDTHAPTVASVNFVTTGKPVYAKEGDTITALLEMSEALSITPSATIAGHAATVTGSGTQWMATYTVDGGVNADNAAFDLGAITDAAGNRTDPVAVDTGIEIDTAAPTVSYALPGSMRVDVSLPAITPTDAAPTDGDFDTHAYRVKFGTELPPGLSLDEVSGRITGTPTTASSAQHDTIIVAIDVAGNSQEVAITFPAVDKGTQTLTRFAYNPSVVTFEGTAPVLIELTGAQGDLSYTSDTPSVCTVEGLTGQLTIVGAGICTIKVSAAATDNYEEATAQAGVTVNPVGALSLTLNTIAGDNTINAVEKATGFAITGNAGSEPIVRVTVTIGTIQLAPVISDSGGAWLVPILADPPYLVEPSVDIRVTATKAGSTDPTPVARTVAVDFTAPTVSYAAPSSLTVAVASDNIDPTDADPTDDDYASHTYAVGAGSTLPPGLSLDVTNGRITGTPTTASTATQTTAIAITDTAGNIQEVLIVFPKVAKGSQSLSDFSYNPTSIAFDDPVPELSAPTGAPGTTIAYMSDHPLVCTVDVSTGKLTIVGDGICTITVTASETDNYQGATAQASVSVSPAGTLALSVDPIAGDDTVNADEKATGFPITGRTGFEPATSVTVTMGTVELTDISGGEGIWSVTVPAAAPYLVDPSVSIEVKASKAGFLDATAVVRTVIVDTIEPSISIVNPDQSSPDQSREFSAGDDDAGTTAWRYLVQSEDNCATVPPEGAVDYAEDDAVTLATEEFNTMHVCFWSTDAAGNVGSSVSAQITGIDTTAPTVGYAAPASMRVGEEIAVIAPTDGVPPDDDFALHTYSVKPASALPDGLSLDGANGSITGTPTTASAGQTTTIVVTDAADNHQQIVVVFPEVAKGYQSLDDFAYNPSSIVFGEPAPALVAPAGAQGSLSYASDTLSVCTVQASTGALTIIRDGACTITLTAAATDDYEGTTAQATVTVHPPRTLGPSVNTIADDDTINAEEKAAGFAITGNTGLESGASVTVAIGSFQLTATSGAGGAWSVTVPASAPYIVEPSATVLVSASKPGFPQARSVTRTLAVDTTAPTVSYAAPESMRVGEALPDIAPTDDTPTDNDFITHKYQVKPAGTLPPGLSLNGATGRITGTPTAASAGSQTTTVIVTDAAGNSQEVVVTFPAVSKGHQSLTDFAYTPLSITFGDPPPSITAPTGAPGAAISYITNSPSVCAVDASTGALAIIGDGTCTITATASSTDDYEGTRAQTSVTVIPAVAIPPVNLAPVVISTLGDHRLTTVGPAVTVDVSMAFSDPDADSLTYTATSNDSDVAAVSLSGSTATIRPLAAGWTAVAVTARDPDGLAATQIILVTVSLANQAPITVGTIAARTLTTGGRNVTLDMSNSFVDPDGDSLIYAAASIDRTVARVRLSGSVLTILPAGPGTAVATVVVRDPSGLTATQSITVTVAPVTAVSSDSEVAEVEASVDTSGAVTVTMRANSDGHSTITVMAPADDGASTVTTAIELEVGEGLPSGTTIALPDSLSRIGKSVTVSLLLSEQEITPFASLSTIVAPLIVDIALPSTPSEPATVCLPIDPEAGTRTAVLLQYDESMDAWGEVSTNSSVGNALSGTQVKCADTKGSSTLAVAYRKSRDATLDTLSLNDLSLRPLFEAGLTEYEVSVAYEVETVTVTAIASDAGASAVAVSPDDPSASTAGHQVPLEVGENVITVTVTAEDASVTGTYTITVTRAPSLEVVSEPSPKPTPPRTGGV